MKFVIMFAAVALIGFGGLGLQAQTKLNGDNTRVELGAVEWNRDLEAAKRQSADTGKPIFVLFQEVPG